jgi:2-iminobutanoate/2-iminopropanoate deaminase
MSGRRAIETESAPAAIGPYSQAIAAGGLVFTAGQIGLDPATGEIVPGGVAVQAERALRNLEAVLDAAGSGFDRVVKTTVYLVDMAHFPAVNEVYARHILQPYPARSTIAARELPKGGLVEIECVALLGPREQAS